MGAQKRRIATKTSTNGTRCSAKELLQADFSTNFDLYYPQSGVLIKFWFDRYGLDKVNKMYALSTSDIFSQFTNYTNESFSAMDSAYTVHCDTIVKVITTDQTISIELGDNYN